MRSLEKWYGKFLMYGKDQDGKEVCRHRHVVICKKAEAPKWKAEQILREIILKETRGAGLKAESRLQKRPTPINSIITSSRLSGISNSPNWTPSRFRSD